MTTVKCEYCDAAYIKRHNSGFNFEDAKFCSMCGRPFDNSDEVYAELSVINCDTCKNNPKYNNGYAPPHTCDICTSLDSEDFEMWEHR
jgi:hypothetical protein